MKSRSKALNDYLQQLGVLNGTTDEIAIAKKEYRKLYKRKWKGISGNTKEIRFTITQNQYEAVKTVATMSDLKHTTYARAVLLHSTNAKDTLYSTDALLKILQLLSMVSIKMMTKAISYSEALTLILEAETLMLKLIDTDV